MEQRWHGLLLASVIALTLPAVPAIAFESQLPPVPTPSLPVPVPVPTVPAPPVPVPSVPVPVPSVPKPTLPKPTLPTPSLPKPSLPDPSGKKSLPLPSVPKPGGQAPAPSAAGPSSSRQSAPTRSPAQTARRQPTRGGASSASARAGAPDPAAGGTTSAARARADQPRIEQALRQSAARHKELPPRRLRQLLEPLAGCVSALGPTQERVLVRRAGLRGFRGESRAELAASLGISRARVARIERRALRTLRRLVRAGTCAGPAPAVAAPATVSMILPASEVSSPDRQAVKDSFASGGALLGAPLLGSLLKDGSTLPPQAEAKGVTSAARSYAHDRPFQFGLAVLVTLLCALLLVRELRRELVR